MFLKKPRYFTVNPNHVETEINLSPGLNPLHELDEYTFKKNDVTECYPDSRVLKSLSKGEIIEVTEKEYRASRNFNKEQISNFIEDLNYLHPLDIEEAISKKVNSVISKEKFIFDLKVAIPKEHANYDVIQIILDKLDLVNETTKVTGFISCSLTAKQIEYLFNQLVDKKFLDEDTPPNHFKALFSESPKQLNWIDTGITRHEPNKQTIYELFYLLKDKYLKDTDLDSTATNPNNLYRKLEYIFPDAKNFAASNPFKINQNTPRKKELKSIIKSL